MSEEKQRYLSYLLRLWPVQEHEQTVWRASLENSQTGVRCGFTNLAALFNFLRQQTAVAIDARTDERRGEKD